MAFLACFSTADTGPGQQWTRRGTAIRLAIAVLVIVAAGCNGYGPTTPSATPASSSNPSIPSAVPLPSSGEAFEVTGVVTDEHGVPVAGAEVTMAHSLGGRDHRPSVRTDASGRYAIGFTSNPWMDGPTGNRGAARAEVASDGYEQYWRTVVAASPPLIENFRLHRLNRIRAGDSFVLSVAPDNGGCTGWLSAPCGRLRVAAPADGNLTVEAVPLQMPAGLPQIQACCASGDERYGNPVTLPVTAGTEIWVEVGQQRPGFTTAVTFIVKTSLTPF
jgi:hypothetical protein